MFGNTYGLDLGTYEIKIYDKKSDELYKVKNTIAIKDKKHLFAIGDDAYEMREKAPSNIEVVFPMSKGVISRFHDMQILLYELLKNEKNFSRGATYIVAVPTDVTEVEKKAFYDLVVHSSAKAKNVYIIDRGVADALGHKIDVLNVPGALIVNLGADTTDLSVVSQGGVVINKLIKRGGNQVDINIQNAIRYKHDFVIGQSTAELIRTSLDLFDSKSSQSISVFGRNLLTGVPDKLEVSTNDIRVAVKDALDECVKSIQSILDRTPPNFLKTILQDGLYLSGGIANSKGIDTYLATALGMKVTVAYRPEFNTIRGLSQIVLSKDLMNLTSSLLDGNYRWMK